MVVVLINKLVFTIATMKERLYHNKAHYYQWKFGKVFYTVQGHGPAVILVHDTAADSSSYEFTRIINTLAKQYRVYTIDLLGYGRSDKPKLTYTAYMFVQLIIDFRKDIVRDKVSIITSGKSCAYATMACYQNHELFRNLIFINPTSLQVLKQNPKNKDKFSKFLLELPVIGTTIYNLKFSKLSIEKSFKTRIFNPLHIKNTYVETYYESSHLSGSASKFVYASDHCKFNNVNITEAIAHINNNIYLIHGLRSDEDCNLKSDEYKSINPAIECSSIDRSKALPHLEKPESTLEILSIYLH